jgi:hypothetical protein
MSAPLIAIFGLGYLAISIDQLVKGNVPMAVTYFGYSLGNVGLYFMAK